MNRDLSHMIDRLLAAARPKRYHPDNDDESEWLATIAETIAAQVDATEAQLAMAHRWVRQRETAAAKSVNRLLRFIAQTGQQPLWIDPLAPLNVRGERVRLDALTPADLTAFADDEDKRSHDDFDQRQASIRGARDISAAASDGGLALAWDYITTLPQAADFIDDEPDES